MYIVGELVHDKAGCELVSDYMSFTNAADIFSEIVISESAATCWMENISASKIGILDITSTTISELFDREIAFNSTSISDHLPIF